MEGTGASLPPSLVEVEPAHPPSSPHPTLLYVEPQSPKDYHLPLGPWSSTALLTVSPGPFSETLPSGAGLPGMPGNSAVCLAWGALSQALGHSDSGREAGQRAILSDLWFPGKDSKPVKV